MFDIRKLKNITLQDKNLLQMFLQSLNEFSCEMSFANLAMWHTAYQTQFAFDDAGRLILYSPVEKMIYFPRGKAISPSELAELSSTFAANGLTENVIYDIPPDYFAANPDAEKFFTIDDNEDNYDYLYDNQHLRDCNGSKLRKKRNLIKQFSVNCPDFEIIELDEKSSERFLALALKLNSALEPCDFLTDEDKVMDFACKNFRELELDGILLADGCGNDVGFSMWSYLNSSTADIHFEKADHSVKGAAQFLTRETAAVLCAKNIRYMNREQDLGDEGIRRAKHSLDPEFLYKRVSATGR